MGAKTEISWTDSTWSPVTGCTKVSEGCDHCYAETIAHRFAGTPAYPNGFAVTLRPERLDQPLRWQRPRRIFVNSMSDLFHADVPDEFIARVWQAMSGAPQHTYQILTKRPGRMQSWVRRWYSGAIEEPFEERPVPGFPGYTITTRGDVIGKRSGAALSPDKGEKGHLRVTMYRDSSAQGERALVHRLMLETFVRPARPGEQACHRNGDASDNRLSNLYWGTQEENWRDRISHGNGRSYAKLTEDDVSTIRRRADEGESAYRIAKDYPVSDTQIRNVLKGAQWALPPARDDQRCAAPARALLDFVWLGTSVESQKWADVRVPQLLQTPAAVRFLSCEPLLGPVDLVPSLRAWAGGDAVQINHHLHWVIVGGESGPHARPMHPDWARSLRDQCVAAGVAFHFKQWGEWAPIPDNARAMFSRVRRNICIHGRMPSATDPGTPMARCGKRLAGRELDGRTWDEYPEARS